MGPSGVKIDAELIDSDWSGDKILRRSQVQNEVLEVAHCSIQKQLADVLTKDVKAEHFIHLRDGIGVAKGESAEYELRDGVGSNSYSEVVRLRSSEGIASNRSSDVIEPEASEGITQKLCYSEDVLARSSKVAVQEVLSLSSESEVINFWS